MATKKRNAVPVPAGIVAGTGSGFSRSIVTQHHQGIVTQHHHHAASAFKPPQALALPAIPPPQLPSPASCWNGMLEQHQQQNQHDQLVRHQSQLHQLLMQQQQQQQQHTQFLDPSHYLLLSLAHRMQTSSELLHPHQRQLLPLFPPLFPAAAVVAAAAAAAAAANAAAGPALAAELKPTPENIRAYPGLFADFQMRALAKAQELAATSQIPQATEPTAAPVVTRISSPLADDPSSGTVAAAATAANTSSASSASSGGGESSSAGSSAMSLLTSPTPSANGGRFACERCRRSYTTAAGLMKHTESGCCSGEAKKFSCTRCHKVYYSLSALKMHIRTHTLPCQCRVCGKAFSRMWLLNGHIRTHTGEKPFECAVCQRAFADRSNLRAHMQTHSEVKKYRCHECGKTFSRMGLLTKHRAGGCPTAGSSVASASDEAGTGDSLEMDEDATNDVEEVEALDGDFEVEEAAEDLSLCDRE